MKRSDFIKLLLATEASDGNPDPEVVVQTIGCCNNGHDVDGVTPGGMTCELPVFDSLEKTTTEQRRYWANAHERGQLVVRCS